MRCCIVQIMNATEDKSQAPYRSFLLLSEIATEELLSQRELAKRLGIAVGLVNSYLKNLVAKGFVRIKAFPKNRYSYLLTPKGIAEKSRLAYQHLSYFTSLYTLARQDYLDLFRSMEAAGVREVVFCGIDEVAEIAYLSLKETGIELVRVMDLEDTGKDFFGKRVEALDESPKDSTHRIVITSLKRKGLLLERLGRSGVDSSLIASVAVERTPQAIEIDS